MYLLNVLDACRQALVVLEPGNMFRSNNKIQRGTVMKYFLPTKESSVMETEAEWLTGGSNISS